jgi:hypothetical protein
MLKKIAFALLGLTSGISSAGTMGPVCTPGSVTVPCVSKHWSFALDALYLNMVEGSARGYRFNSPTTITRINNNWNWGFLAGASYQFNTGNDVTVNWTHVSGSMDQDFPIGGFGGEPRYSLDKDDHFDQVNVVLGQHADFGLVNKMRFYGGLKYANIQAHANNFYPDPFAVPGLAFISADLYEDSDFKGVGPTVGIDYSYAITSQISLTANASSALLFGTSRYTEGLIIYPLSAIFGPTYGSKKVTVPSFEAKLGANYMCSLAQGTLNLDAGYQITHYIDALQGVPEQLFGLPVATSFSLYGPYFGAKFVGNV